MTQWRMSFRVGTDGAEMWPRCKAMSIAAITYKSLAETDLSKYPPGEPKARWDLLESSQKFSLKSVAYEMKRGDIIYVKQGPQIICRGTLETGYQFDEKLLLRDHNDLPWPHHVKVAWEPYFLASRMLLGAEQSTVKRLTPENIAQLEAVFRKVAIS